jgi:hypothetical protein
MARHRSSASKFLRRFVVLTVLGLTIFVVTVGFLARDWRPTLERRLADILGRPISIVGLAIAREWPPQLILKNVTVAANTTGKESTVSIEELSLVLAPWEVLRGGPAGRLSITGLRSARSDGDFSWINRFFGEGRLLKRIELSLQDGHFGNDAVVVDRADLGIAMDGLRSFSGELLVLGEPLMAEGRIGFAEHADKPSLLQLAVRGDLLEVEFDGTLRSAPFGFSGVTALRVLDGDELADRIGLPAFALDRLRATGMIEKTRQRVEITRLEATLGDSKMGGRASYVFSEGEADPRLSLRLVSGPISLNLPGPDDALLTPRELPFDLDLEIVADSLRLGSIHFPRLDAVIKVDGGAVALERLVVDGLGGTIEAAGSLRAEAGDPRVDLLFDLRQADAETVLQALGLESTSVGGRFGAHLELTLAGKNWKAAFDHANGQLGIFLDHGSLARPFLAALTGARADSLPAEAELSCAMGDFSVESGTAHARFLRLVAPEGEIAGKGWIHLPTDGLSLVLANSGTAEPPFLLVRPIVLRGSLYAPEPGEGEASEAEMPTMSTIAALTAALLPQIGSLLGEDSSCLAPPSERNPEGGREEAE